MEFVIQLATEYQYEPAIEQVMRDYYESLAEKDRRRYAAVEATKLPHGGIVYIAGVLGCSERTIRRGIEELPELRDGDPLEGRQRAEGAGRPEKSKVVPK